MNLNSAKRKEADKGIYKLLKIIREEIVKASAELTKLFNSNEYND